jgi:hypothetical protein
MVKIVTSPTLQKPIRTDLPPLTPLDYRGFVKVLYNFFVLLNFNNSNRARVLSAAA